MEIRTKGDRYSETFKIHVATEVEKGGLSIAEANRKYNITGHMTVSKWCRKYGKSTKNQTYMKGAVMAREEHEIIRLHNEIKALKATLEDQQMKNVVLETMVDIAEKELEIPIRKKYGAKQSGK
jgi:transposase-like protein